MIVKIIGLLIGLMLLGTGVSFRLKSKGDPEGIKIYTVTVIVGVIIAAICGILLVI